MSKSDGGRRGRLSHVLGSTPPLIPILSLLVPALLGVLLVVIKDTNASISVAVALLTALIIFVVELIRRVSERERAEDHRSILLAATDNHHWLLDGFRTIAVDANDALDDDENAELYEDLIRVKVDETRRYVQGLARGRVRVPADVVTPMENQIDRANVSVRATTIPKLDIGYWLSPAGRKYLEQNKKAIEKGVTIVRIVLWEDEDKGSEKLATVVREQRKIKIEVLFVKRSEISEKRLKTTMAIYDELTYNDVVFNSDGDAIYVDYYLDPADAKEAAARFEQLRGQATRDVPKELPLVAKAVEDLPYEEPSDLPDPAENGDEPLPPPLPEEAPGSVLP
jgi:hypothetical protein